MSELSPSDRKHSPQADTDLGADSTSLPLIVVFTEDFFLVPRLEDLARGSDYRIKIVDHPSALGAEGRVAERRVPLTEPLEGADAAMVRSLREMHPALLLVDLTCRKLPWRRWIQILKTSAATRRIPIVAFGPHVEREDLEAASRAGADEVITRGRLQASFQAIIQDWAAIPDQEAINSACGSELSELAQRGIQLHNQGDFFKAHEELEHAWMEAPGPAGYLYRALLQVTVAYLHIERGNQRGATKMLLRLRQWLDPLPEVCCGVDVASLKANLEELRAALEGTGPKGIEALDRNLLRPIPLLE